MNYKIEYIRVYYRNWYSFWESAKSNWKMQRSQFFSKLPKTLNAGMFTKNALAVPSVC